ncbi:T9SS type B sorting domain-containing protein [Flavobacterium sp.]|uniref:T9SS type B sorting domain-containing protein n=1 Tax=Flavobacterium sp. TaxID=239 RepID=UPI004047DDA9
MLSRILKIGIVLSIVFLPKIKAENNDVLSPKSSFSVNITTLVPSFVNPFDPTNSYVCQANGVNETHKLKFNVSPLANLLPGNEFSLELSNDGFTDQANTVQIIPISTVLLSGNTFEMSFSFPNNIYGTTYSLRVRSSAPSAISSQSVVFAAYYMRHNQEIKLNNALGVDNVSFCTGSSFTLSIFDSGTSSSPLFYQNPSLTYTWKRQVGSTFVTIPGANGPTYTVSTPGKYYVQTNYGQCTESSSLSKSRIVTVTEAGANSVVISTNPVTNTICEGNGVLLSLNVSNNPPNVISWYLDGELLTGQNTNTHNALLAGSYHASVDNGSCIAESQPYVLTPITFNASIDVISPYELAVGGSVVVTVTTDANTPTFQWFLNDNPISGQTTNTITITQTGEYKVKVTQTVGCIATKEIILVVTGPDVDEIPNLISPNNDGFNDKFKVPFELISSNNLNLEIYNSAGKQIYVTDNYQNNWPEDTNEIFQTKAFFYFKLSKENQLIKEGILTIIK